MTKNNKKIIIDEEGKDCAFYANGECTCSDFCAVLYCADAPLCIYKQWLRKEQECEELKEQLTILDDEDVVVEITVKQFEEYKKLKAENEELKKCYKNNSALLDFEETNTAKLVNKVMKLEKTLAEIKELAKPIQENTCFGMYCGAMNEILNIIKKIENE